MASISLQGDDLIVQLSPLEKIGAVHGDVRVPRRFVKQVRVVDNPFTELKGLRLGTALPGKLGLGLMKRRNGKDFMAVYGGKRGVVIDLAGAPYDRLVVSLDDPEAIQRELRSRRFFGRG